jgi:hypothetical protein
MPIIAPLTPAQALRTARTLGLLGGYPIELRRIGKKGTIQVVEMMGYGQSHGGAAVASAAYAIKLIDAARAV